METEHTWNISTFQVFSPILVSQAIVCILGVISMSESETESTSCTATQPTNMATLGYSMLQLPWLLTEHTWFQHHLCYKNSPNPHKMWSIGQWTFLLMCQAFQCYRILVLTLIPYYSYVILVSSTSLCSLITCFLTLHLTDVFNLIDVLLFLIKAHFCNCIHSSSACLTLGFQVIFEQK